MLFWIGIAAGVLIGIVAMLFLLSWASAYVVGRTLW
jgi:hypothetical protein